MKFTELKKHIIQGEIKPCYVVTGEDGFLVRSAAEMFYGLAGTYPELNLSRFTSDASESDIVTACESLPFCSKMRVVAVEDYSGSSERITDYLKKPCPTTVLIFIGQLSKPLNSVLNYAVTVECSRLSAQVACAWIKREAEQCGSAAADGAALLLIEYCGGFMTRISAETRKLSAYALGGEFTEDDVREMVTPEPDYKIYELSEAIGSKRHAYAAEVLNSLLNAGTPPTVLLGMLYGHFRRLLYVALNPDSDTLSSDLKVKEYAVKMAYKQSRNFTKRALKEIVDMLSEYDYGIKSGKINDKIALTAFVYSLIGKE